MQNRNQAGFFDVGLCAIVITFSGLFVWAIESNHESDTTVARHQQIEQAEARIAEAYLHTSTH